MITPMDVVDHPERDQAWDTAARSETETQRLDRNWLSLLQELRVVQTGVQLLTGFLLTLPFQQRFDVLDTTMRVVYLITVGCRSAPPCCWRRRSRCIACCFVGIESSSSSPPHIGSPTPGCC